MLLDPAIFDDIELIQMNSENKLALIIKLMILDSIALTLIGLGIAKTSGESGDLAR